jgi:lipopolysaccharide/colanic/teichoic acid biosynthesis glycosyltransferase
MRPEFVNEYIKEIQGYGARHVVRPGITGLAQICLPYNANAKSKLEYDVFYIENRKSVFFNLMISAYTVAKMFTAFLPE